jgi:hypothetical protein
MASGFPRAQKMNLYEKYKNKQPQTLILHRFAIAFLSLCRGDSEEPPGGSGMSKDSDTSETCWDESDRKKGFLGDLTRGGF